MIIALVLALVAVFVALAVWRRWQDRRTEAAERRLAAERLAVAQDWKRASGGCTYPECPCPVPCDAQLAQRRG